MREIDLDKPSTLRRTILLYGATRTGKTHFAATAPRPLFISDATEGGWTTIQNMDRALWWEPTVKPQVMAVESVPDMAAAYAKAQILVAGGKVRTIVIDSLTFWADLYLAYLYNLITSHDTRKIYGELGIHLRDLRVKWHSLPANVIWLCLPKEPDEENKIGGPLIPGQQATKFTAGVDNILYARQGAAREWFIHTKKYDKYLAGGREGMRILVDPLSQPTFRSYLAAIGDPEQNVDAPVEMPTPAVEVRKPSTATPAQRGPVRASTHVRGPVRQ